MNRIRILYFNMVLGVHYILKGFFTSLITGYHFQKFRFCTFSALDKKNNFLLKYIITHLIYDRRIHFEESLYSTWNAVSSFFMLSLSVLYFWWRTLRRGISARPCSQKASSYTAQKMKFSIKDCFSKYDQIRSFLRIWSHLLKKSLMEKFIFCAVLDVRVGSMYQCCVRDYLSVTFTT